MGSKAVFMFVLGGVLVVAGITVSVLLTKDKEKDFNLNEDDPYSVRLDDSLRPLHYKIKLQPFLYTNFSIFGSVNINFIVNKTTQQIILHISDIITLNNTVEVFSRRSAEYILVKEHKYNNGKQIYIATLVRELEKGEEYNITLDYVAYMNDRNTGLYRSSYIGEDYKERWMAISQLAPTKARQMFPCFDEPEFRATYTLYVMRLKNMTCLSNSPLISSKQDYNLKEWYWDTFETTPSMSTYLVALVMFSDFSYLETQDYKSRPFRVWAEKGQVQHAKYALEMGPKLLAFYEHFFKVSYPLPKMDMVAVPGSAFNGIQNWGLIIYRNSKLLYDESFTDIKTKLKTALLISHDIGEQWLGNLVTPVWWNDFWMNEGFASYLENFAVNLLDYSMKFLDQMVVNRLHKALQADGMESSHPISYPIQYPEDIKEIFDDITSNKASSLIRMLSFILTEEIFVRGMSDYVINLSYKNSIDDDLWRYLTKGGHEDGTLPKMLTVKEIMETWTLQMGYPLVTVERDKLIGTILKQERYLLNKIPKNSTLNYRWWIPITYTSSNNPNFCDARPDYWMEPTTASKTIPGIPADEKWIVLNIKQSGYYRVNYDEKNWLSLAAQLQDYHEIIDTINRAQILDDSLNLAKSGHLTYEIAFEVLSYLKFEKDYVPLKAALENLIYIKSFFHPLPEYEALTEFFLTLIVPLYEDIGFNESQTDPHLDQLRRPEILSWACGLGYAPCVNETKRIFSSIMKDLNVIREISPNLKRVIYCTAIAEGSEAEWNFAWLLFMSSDFGQERRVLLNALGCSKNIEKLNSYLNMTLDPDSGIEKRYVRDVIRSIANNNHGIREVWPFIQRRWNDIQDQFGVLFNLDDINEIVSKFMCTNEQYTEYEAFLKENIETFVSTESSIIEGQEILKHNINWMKNQAQDIISWLTKKEFYKR